MIESFLFGVTLAISIGPIALLILNLSMTAGMPAGVRSGIGAALADLTYGLVAFLGAGGVQSWLAGSENAVRIAASLVLTGVGVYMLWSAVRSFGKARMPAVIEGHPLAATYLLTLSNPLTLLLFVGFFGGMASRSNGVSPVLLALSLFFGSLLVQMLLALGGGLLAKIIKEPRVLSVLHIVSALGVIGFGVYGMAR